MRRSSTAIVLWNCVLAIFNLVPIPPLDGANVVYGLLPPRQQYSWRTYQQYGPFLLLFILLLAPRRPQLPRVRSGAGPRQVPRSG